jgi:hypothetical protein
MALVTPEDQNGTSTNFIIWGRPWTEISHIGQEIPWPEMEHPPESAPAKTF